MKRKVLDLLPLFLLLVLPMLAIAASQTKSLYKISHVSASEVAITCLNGGDPTGFKVGDTLIISCGR